MATKIELYKCDPLHAKISTTTCKANRARCRKQGTDKALNTRPEHGFITDMPCDDCTDLGAPISLIVAAANKKPLTRTLGGLYV